MLDALEWLAAMCSYVPDEGEQMVRYYGHCNNVSRGRRKKAQTDDQTPYIQEPEQTDKAFRRNWAWLISKFTSLIHLLVPGARDRCGPSPLLKMKLSSKRS